jgi:PEP-CTERM motif
MAYILLVAVTVLMGLSGSAFAGVVPPARVPEPTTLALLAVGFGGVAAVKYFRRK